MGCIHGTNKNKREISTLKLDPSDIRSYPRKATVHVKQRNHTGRIIGTQGISYTHTNPILVSSHKIEFLNNSFWGSACVLPGLDPHGEIDKKCQDFGLFCHDENSTLLALFDGHGSEGEKVVELCVSTVDEFFANSKNSFSVGFKQTEPLAFLNAMMKKVDDEVRNPKNNINATNSGR